MEFQKFIHNEYDLVVDESRNASTPDAELRDVVKQSKRDAEGAVEFNEETLSENESCKSIDGVEEAADMDENAVDDDVKESQSLDEKLLNDKESFAYNLRRLRAQLFEENRNGSMSSTSVEKYKKMVRKFVSKFKH